MIFVAVGTQKFQLNRLLKAIDNLIDQGRLEDEVFAQVGHSDYVPRNYKYADFLTKDEFAARIRECDILITHGGVATIIAGVKQEKAVVVFPRFAAFGEHVDDHQLQITESFSSKNLVLICREKDNLGEIIQQARTHTFARYVSQRSQVTKTIRDFLETI